MTLSVVDYVNGFRYNVDSPCSDHSGTMRHLHVTGALGFVHIRSWGFGCDEGRAMWLTSSFVVYV
jgi:hypothetical protein